MNQVVPTAHFVVGDRVTVREGTFARMGGHVVEVWPERQLLRLSLTVFARAVPVEVAYWQLDPLPPLTEADWLACTRQERLLAYLRGTASDRKLRLLTCAWLGRRRRSRNIRQLLEAAEQFADGLRSAADLERQWASCLGERNSGDRHRKREDELAGAVLWGLRRPAHDAAVAVLRNAGTRSSSCARATHRQEQADLVREVFALPLHRVRLEPDWLRWNDGCAGRVGRAIYEERRFEEMPILADALEEAGCDEEVMLLHCRELAPHVRGCWVLDLLLGKD